MQISAANWVMSTRSGQRVGIKSMYHLRDKQVGLTTLVSMFKNHWIRKKINRQADPKTSMIHGIENLYILHEANSMI